MTATLLPALERKDLIRREIEDSLKEQGVTQSSIVGGLASLARNGRRVKRRYNGKGELVETVIDEDPAIMIAAMKELQSILNESRQSEITLTYTRRGP